jgi:hypothetical protein
MQGCVDGHDHFLVSFVREDEAECAEGGHGVGIEGVEYSEALGVRERDGTRGGLENGIYTGGRTDGCENLTDGVLYAEGAD